MISRRLLRIKVVKALYCFYTSDDSSLAVAQKNTLFSIAKSYDLYHLLLSLVVDVQAYAADVIETKRAKLRPTEEDLNPNMKFVENAMVARIADCQALEAHMKKSSLTWSNNPELIKGLYNNMISKEYYKEYMSTRESSFEQDKAFVLAFLNSEIEDYGYMYEILEELSIFWMDEIEFILSQVIRTVSFAKEKGGELSLLPLYKSEEDLYYVKDLVAKTIIKAEENMSYIEKYTRNWDVDRIAFMDKLIIQVAITEATEFSDIPTKVTMDEFIEIAKFYSTPNSKNFVNGILDKIVTNLESDGKITKSGRGLI